MKFSLHSDFPIGDGYLNICPHMVKCFGAKEYIRSFCVQSLLCLKIYICLELQLIFFVFAWVVCTVWVALSCIDEVETRLRATFVTHVKVGSVKTHKLTLPKVPIVTNYYVMSLWQSKQISPDFFWNNSFPICSPRESRRAGSDTFPSEFIVHLIRTPD